MFKLTGVIVAVIVTTALILGLAVALLWVLTEPVPAATPIPGTGGGGVTPIAKCHPVHPVRPR